MVKDLDYFEKFNADLVSKAAYTKIAIDRSERMNSNSEGFVFLWTRQTPDGRTLVWDNIDPRAFARGTDIVRKAIEADLEEIKSQRLLWTVLRPLRRLSWVGGALKGLIKAS